ncbi:MAG: AMP-binding protein, partial [Rhodospirillales bacterium]|nr:AMP-binding protein [Rhodospirillales bacterium]
MTRATISDFLRSHAVVRPERAAYIYCHGDITWGELDRRVDRLAAGLYARGIRAGDVVAVCVTDGPVQIEMLYAAARLGAI